MDKIASGRYIIAVSGGVDSMALLHMLRTQPELDLVVAHVDHGIRPDSHKDAKLVAATAKKYGLPYRSARLRLGAAASEEAARKARYNFLQQCRKNDHAKAIITAHHQDDLIETALIAIVRGTGWRGLAPFTNQGAILRPLLHMPKHQLVGYARAHNIAWREDSTNGDESYLRNRIRHVLIPTLDQKSSTWQETFLQHIRRQQLLRTNIEKGLATWVDKHGTKNNSLRRYELIMLPPQAAYELLQHVCKQQTGNTLQRPLAESALLFSKVAKPSKVLQLGEHWQLRAESAKVVVEPRSGVVSLKEALIYL